MDRFAILAAAIMLSGTEDFYFVACGSSSEKLGIWGMDEFPRLLKGAESNLGDEVSQIHTIQAESRFKANIAWNEFMCELLCFDMRKDK